MAITIRDGKRLEIIPPRISAYAARKMGEEKKPNSLLKRAKDKKVSVREI